MPKHLHQPSPRIRRALRARTFSQMPPAERLPPASGLDADIRKDGARRPLRWDDESPTTPTPAPPEGT